MLRDLVIQYRTEHGLSQRQFALQCGLSNGYISMIEKNRNPNTGLPMVPSLSALNKLAGGMGITLDTLFALAEDMPVDISVPEDAPTMNCGDRIRALREKLGLTLEQVGAYIGVNKATVLRYEGGSIDVNRIAAVKLSECLHTTPAYIMGWTDNPDLSPDPRVAEFAELFSQLPPDKQEFVLAALRGMKDRND